jgi:hypothetical protein
MTKPYGNTSAAIVLMSPGAFSWYQGAVLVEMSVAHAKDKIMPAEQALRKLLSIRICAFLTPIRDTSSKDSWGVYALFDEWCML